MNCQLPTALALAFLVAGDAPDQTLSNRELKKWEGTWKITYCESNGKALPKGIIRGGELVLKGANYTWSLTFKKKG
jgi:hypothetical protein